MNHSQSDLNVCAMPDISSTGTVPVSNAKSSSANTTSNFCFAPVFEGSSALACLFLTIINLLILFALIIVLIFSFGSRGIRCAILQIQFRLKHCRKGNTDPSIPLGDPYAQHVHSFRMLFGKDSAWEQFMLANRNRYQRAFELAASRPNVLVMAFRYFSIPIAYDPPWASEAEHMQALETMAELTYVGYDFKFNFNGNTSTSYANVIGGIQENASHALGKDVFLFYETIFGHEFGHLMGVLHHYDTVADIGTGQHMPPGENKCLMDRNINQYCSACRTALFIPLNVDNAAAIEAANDVILRRYPF